MGKQGARKTRAAAMPSQTKVETSEKDQKGAVMNDAKKAQELFAQGTGKVVETITLWADANQRVLREVAELSAATAKEGVRLYAELQQSGIEAVREAQVISLRWHATWNEAPRDPLAWYQRALTDSVEQGQKWFRMLEGSAQAMTRSAERLQTSAEQAGKGIQESFSEAVTKLKDVYAA
jgi:predicted deacylase